MPEAPNRAALQKRTLRVLMLAVIPAGAGFVGAVASIALLAKEITGSDLLGGIAGSATSLGAALATMPMARYASQHGRRAALRSAWFISAVGAAVILVGANLDFYLLIPLGALLLGVASAATLSARFAAADLATEDQRAKAIGTLMWAVTAGGVIGPTLALGKAGQVSEWLGMPELAGAFLLGIILLLTGAVVVHLYLRPDPLEIAGHLGDPTTPRKLKPAIASIRRVASARLATTAMITGQFVMVSTMSMTPLHMKDGNQQLRIIGFVISVHVLGMYGFAPLVGRLVDRIGPRLVIAAGGVVLFVGAQVASVTDPQDRDGLFVGLFLIGLGWCLGIVAASSLLTGSFSDGERVMVQGASDLAMITTGAASGLAAGFTMQQWGFAALSRSVSFAGIVLALYSLGSYRKSRTEAPVSV